MADAMSPRKRKAQGLPLNGVAAQAIQDQAQVQNIQVTLVMPSGIQEKLMELKDKVIRHGCEISFGHPAGPRFEFITPGGLGNPLWEDKLADKNGYMKMQTAILEQTGGAFEGY